MIKKLILLPLAAFVIGALASPGLAQTTAKNKTVDLACLQTAVEKRDAAIISAFDGFTVKIKSALETRKSALKAAWGMTDKAQRKAGLDAAWKSYKDATKPARQALNQAGKDAWKAFLKDRRTCKATGASEDSGNEAMDNNL